MTTYVLWFLEHDMVPKGERAWVGRQLYRRVVNGRFSNGMPVAAPFRDFIRVVELVPAPTFDSWGYYL